MKRYHTAYKATGRLLTSCVEVFRGFNSLKALRYRAFKIEKRGVTCLEEKGADVGGLPVDDTDYLRGVLGVDEDIVSVQVTVP